MIVSEGVKKKHILYRCAKFCAFYCSTRKFIKIFKTWNLIWNLIVEFDEIWQKLWHAFEVFEVQLV